MRGFPRPRAPVGANGHGAWSATGAQPGSPLARIPAPTGRRRLGLLVGDGGGAERPPRKSPGRRCHIGGFDPPLIKREAAAGVSRSR
ncbi:hypothetical protein GCM10010116_11920 [Microbispora rosea subsp. aerata]|nr:hypothetical protein GCM10010116_11920 [Microbispora rosea subsp. aerata]